MELPDSALVGPIGPLLWQLHSLVVAGNDIPCCHDLAKELKNLYSSIEDLLRAEDPSHTAMWWMKEVRDLCIKIKDYCDLRLQTEWDLEGFVTSVQDLIRTATSLQLAKGLKKDPTPDVTLHLPVPAAATKHLVKLLAFGDEKAKQLRVVTIFGFAGAVNTDAARTLYGSYGGRFQCRAFARVSKDPDMRSLFTSILSQIKAPPEVYGFSSDVNYLIRCIRNHLLRKRYFIVIDDLWTIPERKFILGAFPDGYCHSRIITTTQSNDVALASSDSYLQKIYEMTPLNDDQSGRNPTPEGMKEELNLIYSKLPPELKTCLLYFNMYPPDYTITKDELVKQWTAECFQPKDYSWKKKELARQHFDELVRKKLIQPVERNCNDEVMSCTVEHMVLDIIARKSMELDFITIVNYMEKKGLPHKAHRLSIQFRDEANAKMPRNIILTNVRSLAFSGFHGSVPSLVECRLLQVLILHIWSDRVDETFDISIISELLQMRYVKIASNVTVNLPAEIAKLKFLKTLEVDARVCTVPSDITGLPGLLHLSLPSTNLPRDVSAMESLCTLGCFDLSRNSEQEVKKLINLKSLEDLHLTCSAAHQANMQEKMDVIWCSILSPHSSLKSVDLLPRSSNHVNTYFLYIKDTGAAAGAPSNASDSPSVLERLELSPRICIFSSIPGRLAVLGQLRILKIAVRELSEEGVEVLKTLPTLAALSLYVWTTVVVAKVEPPSLLGREKMPIVLVAGLFDTHRSTVKKYGPARIKFGKVGFRVLSYFRFTCPAPCLVFQEKAMPSIRRLKLRFNATRISTYSLQDAGLENLTGLQEISLKIGKDSGFKIIRREPISAYESSSATTTSVDQLTGLDRILVKIGSVGADESDRRVAETKLASLFKNPPVVNIQSVDHNFGADKPEQADRSYMSTESTSHPKSTGEEESWSRTYDVHHEEAMQIIIYIVGHKNYKFIQQEMELMNLIIERNHEGNQGSFQEKWVVKLQELVYDIDDFRNNLSLLTIRSFFSTEMLIINMLDRMKHLKGRINTLRNWQQHTSQCSQKGDSTAATMSTPLGYQNPFCYTDLVGIDGPIRELLWLMPHQDMELKVVGIVGCRGMGKSTLAGKVYDIILHKYSHDFVRSLWVVASDCTSSWDLLNKIHQELFPHEASSTTNNYYERLRNTMRQERYILVIDQVERAEVWYGVQGALQNNNKGSRIILTTSILSVAAATTNNSGRSYVYTMRGLDDADSKSLFWKKFYDRDTEPAPLLADVSDIVIKKCDGLPLSLLSMARYMGQLHRTGRIERFGGYIGGAPEALGEMYSALAQCYSSLPDNGHRTCLLSLSIFPQGHQINRKSLIRRWVAEGLVVGDGERNAECVAADCFDKLIDRNIIEPVMVGNSSRVKRCRVHGLMLDFIVNKAISRNFVTLIRKDDPLVPPLSVQEEPLVRRISVQDSTVESGKVATEIGLSVVRSLTIFKSVVFDLQSCKLLRILDLEGCTGINNAILDAVCQLMILKYLTLRGSDVPRIPKRIRRLQYLETLDLRDTKVEKLPIEVIMLPWLAHLFGKFDLPRELKDAEKTSKLHKFLQEKSRLQTLSGFVMDNNSGFEAIILDARSLRKVKIWCRRYPAVPSEGILVSSLNRLFAGRSALQSLSIDLATTAFLHSLEAPCKLSSMKLSGQIGKIPKFITSHETTLRELQLSFTGLSIEELSLLQKLRCLLYLKLSEDGLGFGSGNFVVNRNGFPSLERLCFQAPTIPQLDIENGAKTKLTSLYLLCPEYPPSRINGIEYLQHLNEVVLHGSLDASQLEVWKETAMKHLNRPRVTKQA